MNDAAIKLLVSSAQLDKNMTRQESSSTCAIDENVYKTQERKCEDHPFENVEHVIAVFDAFHAS